MRRPNPKAMTIEDFFLWQERQPDRYEFVEGWPIKMMTGARQGHNVVASNIVMTLGPQVKALGCRTTSSDTAVRTHKGIRYPDVVIDCAPPAPSAFEAGSPHLVVEVSSPSTLSTDLTDKLDEYLAHEGLRLVMLVEPDVVSVKLYRRDAADRWQVERYDQLDETIDLPELSTALALSAIYDTLRPDVRPFPRAVE